MTVSQIKIKLTKLIEGDPPRFRTYLINQSIKQFEYLHVRHSEKLPRAFCRQ